MDKLERKSSFLYEDHEIEAVTKQIMESYETGTMGRYSHGDQEETNVISE
ncbi:MAG TPA: hypothetical protein VEY51_03230 [Chondromyces sp.]|nr:hypothetical protein [Chondromyces sp.]